MSINLVQESNPEREKQDQQNQAPLARARLLQRLLAPTPNLPQYLYDIVYTQAVVVAGTEAAAFIIEPGEAEGEVALRNVAHIRPDNSTNDVRERALKAFSELVGGAIREGRDIFVPVGPPGDAKEPQYCLVTLLRADNQVVAATAVITRCLDDARAQQRLEAMQLVAGYFELYLLRRNSESSRQMAANHQDVLQYAGALATSDGFRNGINNLCNELASRTGATRVSVGWVHRGLKGEEKVKLKGLSHTEEFDKKQELSVQIVKTMEECLDQNEVTQYDPVGEASTANTVREAANLSKMENGSRVVSLPMRRKDETIGVITLEFPSEKQASDQEATGLAVAAELLAPQLYDRYNNDRWLVTKAGVSARDVVKATVGPKYWTAKVLITLSALVLWALCGAWVPGKGFLFAPMYRVKSTFTFVPEQKRIVSAPVDGMRIKDVLVLPGDEVKLNQVLLVLDTDELQQQKKRAESQSLAKLAESRAALERNDGRDHQAEAVAAQREAEAAQAEADYYDTQIEKCTIRATIAGTVLNADLRERRGDVVKRGEPLFEIAQQDAGLKLEIDVPERDIQLLSEGDKGTLRTTARPDMPHTFVVDRIVPQGTPKEGKNVFKVYGKLDETRPEWKPGANGEAAIDEGPKPLVWQWTHRLVDWVRLKLWI